MKKIELIIDQKIIDEYNDAYFRQYPRRKKKPIVKPIPPSLNRFIAMKRMQQNSTKQKYKEFSCWLANYFNIANLNLGKAKIIFTFYFPDHRRRDFDNLMLTPKFLDDGWILSKTLKDDNGENLMLEFREFRYDAKNPRLVIEIEYDEENIENG